MNPNLDKAEHVLMIDDRSHLPALDAARATAPLYELTDAAAGKIIDEVLTVTATWRQIAQSHHLPVADVAQMESAFLPLRSL